MRVRKLVAILSLAVFGYVIHRVASIPVEWETFSQISPLTLAFIAAAQLIHNIVSAIQWKLLQDRLQQVSLVSALRIILSTLYAGYFPFRGTMIFLRVLTAKREGISYPDGAVSLFVHFVGRWVILCFAVLLVPLVLPQIESNIVIAPVAVAACVLGLYLLRARFLSWTSGALRKAALVGAAHNINTYSEALEPRLRLLAKGKTIVTYVALYLASASLAYYAMALLWEDLGFPLPVHKLLLISFTAMAIGWISQLPGGIGPCEATYAYLVSLLGAPLSLALAVGFLWRFITMVVDLLTSAVAWAASWGSRGVIAPENESPSNNEGDQTSPVAATTQGSGD